MTMDATDIAKVWRRYRQRPTDELRNQLVEHYLQIVRFNAERIRTKLPVEVELDDLLSAGTFGLMGAIDTFDLDRGIKFETYCSPRIRGAILDELRSMDWVPRLVRNRSQRIEAATKTLRGELGHVPSDAEVAQRIGVPLAEFRRIARDGVAVSMMPISRKQVDDDHRRDGHEFDILQDHRTSDPATEAQKRDLREYIEHVLSRTERLILVLYYYEQMTMKEIGETLDLSESRVSQMHSAIVERLRFRLRQRATALPAEV
jgi:RNA polymerase sigma factor for flagellar operon FliA